MSQPPNAAHPPLEVMVWGEMALFTRPEAKAERVSYPVPTPSAARGILEAIYWKPQFRYRIREIVVLTPIRYASLLRNEVEGKAGAGKESISVTDTRQQRHSLVLRGVKNEPVRYVIRADVLPADGVDENQAKFRDIFRRRVQRGECFQRPYLGCREFACDFALPSGTETVPHELRGKTADLGLMLLDIAFSGSGASGINVPFFYQATLKDGVLRVPNDEYERMEALRL